jgi:dATP pyrophosphohydrolase
MARAKFQVLIIPFRKSGSNYEFAVFKRSDGEYWQGIAGGGEDDESPLEGAMREAEEEAGIPGHLPFYRLQTMSSIPVCHFAAREQWSEGLYVIPEYSFGVDCTGHEIKLSKEHAEFKWGSYEEINRCLTWDSNKTALWELNERLRKHDL